ncbi:DivIVA domain-containing protein [Kocuria sp. p3-SID1433]|uniref:DivIVA domain-containing protein n=1 Tax=unclassified Kocuria TaxID=2649579 RepID=UPI0021A8C3E3|nr:MULTISPECIES: DivIVA domain-containing protein [unclassified Kocuria]MCT1602420.1 DivIVA domain-containing protein [Kocuria sp. p3-SID1428]MCT2180850.1 DivIVA domain-containing protein [Kocuria sp. p3-SID1433]
MALTPEDVINKRFQPTKFREGYDQDEVDDFLDEIVVELRRLNQENAELRDRLDGAGSTEAPAAASGAETSSAAAAQSSAPEQETLERDSAPVAQEPEAPVETAAPSEKPQPAADDYTASAESAAGVLAMAQKLHDQYVDEGRAERDRLIDEARTRADGLVSEAETTKTEVLSSLEKERRDLEVAVSDLRSFESSYRERLAEFIGGQLEEIKTAPSLAPESSSDAR